MATAQEYIDAALRTLGIISSGSSPSADESADALEILNWMIQGWASENLMVPYHTKDSLTLTASQQVYTIGSGGDFNVTRPTSLTHAYLEDSGTSYPMEITTLGEYVRIEDKAISGRPERLWYNPEYSLGKITFDLSPDSAYSFILYSLKPFSGFAALSTETTLPDEYNRLIHWNLAVELAPQFGRKPDQIILGKAMEAKKHIIARNLASRTAQAQVDDALRSRGVYNIEVG